MTKGKGRRSRRGCASCRRLKIKCDERRPHCEYCTHTRRQCIYPEDETSVVVNKNSCSLNAVLVQLSLTRFETRLVHFFFNYCIPMLSYGQIPTIEYAWKAEVPRIFVALEAVRLALFAFLSINLWPCVDMAEVQSEDRLVEIRHMNSPRGQLLMDPSALESALSADLYKQTLGYFDKALKKSLSLTKHLKSSASVDDHGEFMILGILLFGFLGIHPYKVMPLITFDVIDGDYLRPVETDFLSYARSFNRMASTSLEVMSSHSIGSILSLSNESFPFQHIYPLVENLHHEMALYYPFDEISSLNQEEVAAYTQTINVLQLLLELSVLRRYPLPLILWMEFFPDLIHVHIRQRHPLALHFVFMYAWFCIIIRFNLYEKENLWFDFIKSYADLSGLSSYESMLLDLITKYKCRIGPTKARLLSSFDPVEAHAKYVEGDTADIFEIDPVPMPWVDVLESIT